MSWKKTTICGRVMFEREDGVRVDSDEQIKAIEDSERQAFRSREHGYSLVEKALDLDERPVPVWAIWASIAAIGLMISVVLILASM